MPYSFTPPLTSLCSFFRLLKCSFFNGLSWLFCALYFALPTSGQTITNCSYIFDRCGNEQQAYSFDGVDDYINTPYVQTNLTGYTFSAWVLVTDPNQTQAVISQNRGPDSGGGISLTLFFDKGEDNVFTINFGLDGDYRLKSVKVPYMSYLNQWVHVVGVWQGLANTTIEANQMQIYLNGALVTGGSYMDIGSATLAPLTGLGSLKIGHHQAWNKYFKGSMDDVHIYNRALSQSEVNQLRSRELNCSSSVDDQALYYRFEGNMVDSSGNGNNGEAYGFDIIAAPSLTASTDNSCAGTVITISATGCAGILHWGTGHEAVSSITVSPKSTSIYGAWCESGSGCVSDISTIKINIQELIPTIKVTASTFTTILPATSVTFTTTITNGGDTPIYQWQKNGSPVGDNSPIYTDNSLMNNDRVSCLLTSNATCRQLTNVVSNVLEFSILTLTTDASCVGSELSLSEQPYSEIIWKRNGVPIDNRTPWDSVNYYNNLKRSNRVVVAGIQSQFSPYSVFRDRAGNIYVDTYGGTSIRKFQKWLPGADEAERFELADLIDSEGNFYKIDKVNHQVLKYTPGSSIGLVVAGGNGAGSASNQLNTPSHLFVDEEGSVYVADLVNFRFQKWLLGASNGITVVSGAVVNQLQPFRQFRVDQAENIYTLSTTNSYNYYALNKITSATNSSAEIGVFRLTSISQGIFSLNLQGDFYIADNSGASDYYQTAPPNITKWHIGKKSKKTIFTGRSDQFSLSWISDVYVDSKDDVLASNISQVRSVRYGRDIRSNGISTTVPDAKWGKEILSGHGKGPASNQLASPQGICVDKNGAIYVSDQENHRVQKWLLGANSGVTVAGGNGAGGEPNQLNNPVGIWVDSEGSIFIADSENHRVQKWLPGATAGITIAGGNGEGAASNQLSKPMAVAIDSKGAAYIADWGNNRFQKWSLGATDGSIIMASSGGDRPNTIFIDRSDNLYVAKAQHIEKWVPGASTGVVVAQYSKSSATAPRYGINNVRSIYVDSLGTLYTIASYYMTLSSGYLIKFRPNSTVGEALLNNETLSSVFVDSKGSIYLSDVGSNNVFKYQNQNKSLLASEPGAYTAEVRVGEGMISTSTITISSPAVPSVSSTSDALCTGESTTLMASGCEGEVSWNTGQVGNNALVSPTETTIYFASCIVNNCTSPSSSPITITVSTGALCQSITTGLWKNASTWSCGRIPLLCDDIVIQAGHIVTLDTPEKVNNVRFESPSSLQFLNGGSLKIGRE